MKKNISIYSFLLFLIPAITLFICYLIHVYYYDLKSIPFIDGEVSVSLVGRQEKTIIIFRSGLLLYALVSILFYFKVSNFLLSINTKNKFKGMAIFANFFLCVYLFALGKQEPFFEVSRRISIILFITTMYINHIYLLKMLRNLNFKRKIELKKNHILALYLILIIITILVIIGLPWVNPLFKYPDKLKNIVEWNLLFLIIIFYLHISHIFHKSNKS